MNTKTSITILLFGIFLFGGCKQLIMWRYGIHQPREISKESLNRFLEKHHYPQENNFIFGDSSAWLGFFKDSVMRTHLLTTTFFTRDGMMDQLTDSSDCQWSGGKYARLLKNDTIYHVDTAYTISRLLENLTPLNSQLPIDTSRADFYALITWGSFLGKMNERLFDAGKTASEQQMVRIIPIYLSLDMIKEWHLTKKQKMHFKNL